MGKTIPNPNELAKSSALIGAYLGAHSANTVGKAVGWGLRGIVTLALDAVHERPYTLGREGYDNGLAAERDDHDGNWEPQEPVDLRERLAPSIGSRAIGPPPEQPESDTVVPLATARDRLLARTLVPHKSV